jgi:hypothetical protein
MARATKSFLKHKSRFSRANLSIFLICFILIGGIIIWRSLAAPNPNLTGDLNGDNTVNIQDLSILLSNYGSMNSVADINNDGTVSILDLSALLSHYGQSYSASSNVSIDFSTVTQTLTTMPFSGTISTYGESGGSIAASAKQRTELGELGPGLYRIPLKWNGGNIISAAGGGPTNITGDTWINDIKAFGGTPMIVLGGSTSDNDFTPTDAVNMLKHFNGTNGPKVSYWVIGNEPNNAGISIGSYCTLFNSTVSAMKAVDSSIKVAGPAWSYFNLSDLTSFLQCAGNNVDIIDYHHYAMGSTSLDSATTLSQTSGYETEIKQIKQAITQQVPARAANIEVQVGEYNWSWRTADGYQGYNGDDRFYQSVNTVWSASVLGHVISAGGRAHQYSDQNGALGITFEKSADATHFGKAVDDPMPIYYGIQMFSGGSLFRSFGASLVKATTSLNNVEVFASTNQKNVVLINKNASLSQTAVIQLSGSNSTSVDVWQTNNANPFSAPQKMTTSGIQAGGDIQVMLPPYSVTTLVLN